MKRYYVTFRPSRFLNFALLLLLLLVLAAHSNSSFCIFASISFGVANCLLLRWLACTSFATIMLCVSLLQIAWHQPSNLAAVPYPFIWHHHPLCSRTSHLPSYASSSLIPFPALPSLLFTKNSPASRPPTSPNAPASFA